MNAQPLDVLATQRDELREAKRALEAQIKALDSQLAENEQAIIEALDTMGVNRASVGKLSMSISETTVGNVQDWDKVYEFIHENNAFHLLQRRLSNSAYKELLDLGEAPEGIEPFVKRSLNFRKSA